MRWRGFSFGLIILIILYLIIRSVFTLLALLFQGEFSDGIPAREIRSANSTSTGPSLIPKIIHQTYKDNDIPTGWREAQQSCIDLHPDYKYILWTDDMARTFIATHYPWFLETFEGYKYPIQRADSIRYFVLYHYGGIYIDLDDGCNRKLDPLLVYPAFLRRTVPIGISNDVMGSMPRHPFFHNVIQNLQSCDHSFVLPYLTVLFSTGPTYLSIIWKEYTWTKPIGTDRVRILMIPDYKHHSWSFFRHHLGNSWHQGDAQVVFWMWAHWPLVTLAGFAVLGLVGFCLWIVYSRLFIASARYYHGRYRYTMGPTPSRSPIWSPRYLRRGRSLSWLATKSEDRDVYLNLA
ncbi:nucleotide-diphospho-sugar transferase [Aspergillus pseudodeflectus]|uniref:Nucleotide-diphospho-sugar transferase n=1 Tax=Aspergillus pseudodeflectus TaxID=176178 RepID=A0ABR4JIN4_9EURO